MRIRLLKGVSGSWKGRDFRFPRGSEVSIESALARDLIKGKNAVEVGEEELPKPEAIAITPMINRVVKTTIRRRKNVQADNSTRKRAG